MSKYEPTAYMKRIIMFNRDIESSYQAIRKSMHEHLFGELTPEEEARWKLPQRLSRAGGDDE